MKDADTDKKKMKKATEKILKEAEEATKDLNKEDTEKFIKEYMEAAMKCDPTKNKTYQSFV